jgi:hypothetical protein
MGYFSLSEGVAMHRAVKSNSSTKTGARSPNSSLSVTRPDQNKRHRYIRAVFGPKDRRFPKRDPEIEAMYPGHCIPSSPQMLEELLRRSLELEQSRSFVFGPRGGASMNIECGHLDHRARFNVLQLPASHYILRPAIGSRSKWKAGAIGHERTATA